MVTVSPEFFSRARPRPETDAAALPSDDTRSGSRTICRGLPLRLACHLAIVGLIGIFRSKPRPGPSRMCALDGRLCVSIIELARLKQLGLVVMTRQRMQPVGV